MPVPELCISANADLCEYVCGGWFLPLKPGNSGRKNILLDSFSVSGLQGRVQGEGGIGGTCPLSDKKRRGKGGRGNNKKLPNLPELVHIPSWKNLMSKYQISYHYMTSKAFIKSKSRQINNIYLNKYVFQRTLQCFRSLVLHLSFRFKYFYVLVNSSCRS